MADISVLSRVLNGAVRNVDLSSNTIVVSSIKIGSVSPTELTKTILDRLIALQNGTDVDASYHTHDGRYYTETEISSTGATPGASLVGVNGTPTNYSPSANNVQKHLEAIDVALSTAGGSSFSDDMFEIYDDGDATKKIAFQASGISASTTRTITMPDANVNLGEVNTSIQQNGSRAFTANQSMGGFNLTNLADPVGSQDAATMAWVLARIAGIAPKKAARVSSQANVDLSTALEDGDTLDGILLATGDRVLVRAQTAPEENGIYIVQASGAAVRATDFDETSPIDEINGAWIAVQEGTDAGKVFVQFGSVADVGTDPIEFEYWNPIAGLIGGDMITFAGSTFSVDLATVSGLESTNPGNVAGQLRIKLEASNPSLQIDGSNQLGVKLSASGAITSGGSGLQVGVDNSTIEINTNALRIKASGVGTTQIANTAVDKDKINTNVFDQVTITGGAGSSAAVQQAPKVAISVVAGESMAANTTWLVRRALFDLSETVGRVYKADKDATSEAKYVVIGWVRSASTINAGDTVTLNMVGSSAPGSFSNSQIGREVFLGSAGAAILGASLANTSGEAQVAVGVVSGLGAFDFTGMQLRGIA